MTFVIAEACVDLMDRGCVDACPVDCIHEVSRMLVIDPVECIDCGACLPECPVGAIYRDDELPPRSHAFLQINAAWEQRAVVDRLIDAWTGRIDTDSGLSLS